MISHHLGVAKDKYKNQSRHKAPDVSPEGNATAAGTQGANARNQLYCEPISQNHDTVQLLMPDDFKPPQSLHVVCEVVSIAKDSKFYGEVVDRIVTERRMLQEIKIEGETYYLVLENYVFGRIQ